MYIAITKQHSGLNYKGSVRDFVKNLEKENEDNKSDHLFETNIGKNKNQLANLKNISKL